MQTNSVLSTSAAYYFESPRPTPVHKPVLTIAPLSSTQPASARVQPPNSLAASYSPDQPASVQQAKANQRQSVREQQTAAQVQQRAQKVQMADARMAANVLTGAYNAEGAKRVGAPRVGGYLTEVA